MKLQDIPLPNIPAHFPENEHFFTPCPKSLLSVTANDLKIVTRLGSKVKLLSTEGGAGELNQA